MVESEQHQDGPYSGVAVPRWRRQYGVVLLALLAGCCVVLARLFAQWSQRNAQQPVSDSDVNFLWKLLSVDFLVVEALLVGGVALVFGRRGRWAKGLGCLLGLVGLFILAYTVFAVAFITFFDPN